jgi:hypothetical protein
MPDEIKTGNRPLRPIPCDNSLLVAGTTRLELATSGVTGRVHATKTKALSENPNDFNPCQSPSVLFNPFRAQKTLARR